MYSIYDKLSIFQNHTANFLTKMLWKSVFLDYNFNSKFIEEYFKILIKIDSIKNKLKISTFYIKTNVYYFST